MSEFFKISQDDDIMDVARKWYLKLEDKTDGDQDIDQFEEWVNANPAHRDAFNDVVDFWSHIDAMPEIQAMRETGGSFQEDTPLPAEDENVIRFETAKNTAGPKSGWQKWLIAASVLIACAFIINSY
ncbi:MAG TPA: FecR/PupR family sigma factor regulator, partial [Sphingomonadales bacterium]|nr:FecR/PupR family sigma factor regulator [Sphingomonadales bacterium]